MQSAEGALAFMVRVLLSDQGSEARMGITMIVTRDNNDKQKALSLNKIFRICLLVFCLFVCSRQRSASSLWSLRSLGLQSF